MEVFVVSSIDRKAYYSSTPRKCLETADDCFGDALHAKFGDRVELWVKFVFRFEVGGLGAFLNVALECGFTVDEGGYDVAIVGVAWLDDDHVAIVNFGIDHTFASDLEGEAAATAGEACALDVDL